MTASDDHAYLEWRSVDRATGYRIYRRDVTGGQTHFARLPESPPYGGFHVRRLIPGHEYEFRMASLNGLVEGPLSAVATATPHSTRRAADVIRYAGTPEAIEGSYIVTLRQSAVPPENLEPFLRELLTQYGATLTVVLKSLHGGATMTESQALDLAAHPDVDDVEQNATATLD